MVSLSCNHTSISRGMMVTRCFKMYDPLSVQSLFLRMYLLQSALLSFLNCLIYLSFVRYFFKLIFQPFSLYRPSFHVLFFLQLSSNFQYLPSSSSAFAPVLNRLVKIRYSFCFSFSNGFGGFATFAFSFC